MIPNRRWEVAAHRALPFWLPDVSDACVELLIVALRGQRQHVLPRPPMASLRDVPDKNH